MGTTTTRPIPIGPSAEKGVQLPEHDEYDGDEPLVIKKPEKDAITFHPEIVKQTLAKLDNLSKDELELINKFVDAYKNKVTSSKPPRTTTTSTTTRSTTTTTEAETTRAETTTVGEEDYDIDFDVFGTDKPEPESNFVPVSFKCENLHPPKNGFLQYSHSLDEGSIVTYSCIKGYEIRQRGSTRKCVCSSNGCEWTKKARVCDQRAMSDGLASAIIASNKQDKESRREERKQERLKARENKNRLSSRRENQGRQGGSSQFNRDENFADPIEIKPLGNSWARTLVGPKDTSQYFNDYFGGSSDVSTYEEVEEFTQRPRRPPSPQEYYQQQKYHFTPTEKPMHDSDDEETVHNGVCPALTLEFGQIFCSAGYREGSRCTYSCQRGYKLGYQGRSVRCTCNSKTGCMWNRPPQICVQEG